MGRRNTIITLTLTLAAGMALLSFINNYRHLIPYNGHFAYYQSANVTRLTPERDFENAPSFDMESVAVDSVVAMTPVGPQTSREPRVLCWVMTHSTNVKTKVAAVNATWGPRCDILLFMSDEAHPDPAVIALDVPPGRNHLTAKSLAAFDYIHRHHPRDADWFLKADDDTYVIVENLRYMLSAHDPKDAIFFGHHFQPREGEHYFSGGGGYVLSFEAVRRLGQRKPTDCAKDGGAEDMQIAKCLRKLKIKPLDTVDGLGRSRFHCFSAENMLTGRFPDWYLRYDHFHGFHKGADNISDYAVSFHYISPSSMYLYDLLLYHIRPRGLKEPIDINLYKSKMLSGVSELMEIVKNRTAISH